MSKHTPGPMHVGYDGPSRPIIHTGNHGMLSVSKFQDGRWVSYEEEDADCVLFAAAPELLEALVAATNDVALAMEIAKARGDLGVFTELRSHLAIYRTAIAKATGDTKD